MLFSFFCPRRKLVVPHQAWRKNYILFSCFQHCRCFFQQWFLKNLSPCKGVCKNGLVFNKTWQGIGCCSETLPQSEKLTSLKRLLLFYNSKVSPTDTGKRTGQIWIRQLYKMIIVTNKARKHARNWKYTNKQSWAELQSAATGSQTWMLCARGTHVPQISQLAKPHTLSTPILSERIHHPGPQSGITQFYGSTSLGLYLPIYCTYNITLVPPSVMW